MAGSDAFRRARPILFAMAAVLRVLPGFLRSWLWLMADAAPGATGAGLRYAIARANGAQLGENVFFGRNVTVKHWRNFRCGENVSFHENCFLDAIGGIEVGDNVSMAHGGSLISFDHVAAPDAPIKYGSLQKGPIRIANDVWISAGVRILRDTSIGARTIIAANAVARGDLAGGAVYGGTPARFLKKVDPASAHDSPSNKN